MPQATPLVSVIIPTFNSANFLADCLSSIQAQTYKQIEVLVIDSFSTDNTSVIARQNGGNVVEFGHKQSAPFEKFFGAPYQQKHGAEISKGEYLYLVDSDMRPTRGVVEQCVRLSISQRFEAVIIPEVSYGNGFWSSCKGLERSLYSGSDAIESPRFVSRHAWDTIKGIDPDVEGFYDWDLSDRLRSQGHKIGRIKDVTYHFEGRLSLSRLIRKKYTYGKRVIPFLRKHRGRNGSLTALERMTPLRGSYLTNAGLIAQHPAVGMGFVLMKSCEFAAAAVGMIAGLAEGLL